MSKIKKNRLPKECLTVDLKTRLGKHCEPPHPLLDKDQICVWCGEKIDCDWWHNITYHNMPLTWDVNQSFHDKKTKKKLREHLHYHIGWLGDQIMDSYGQEKGIK